MARDPFAPVPQSSVPQFVWIIVGVVGLLVVGVGTTMAIVISKRPPPVAIAPVAPTGQPAPVAGPAAATTKVATNDAQPAGASASDSKPDKTDKADKADKPEKKHHKSSGGGSSSKSAKVDSKPTPSAPPPPKKQNNMSQKEIDKLLGI